MPVPQATFCYWARMTGTPVVVGHSLGADVRCPAVAVLDRPTYRSSSIPNRLRVRVGRAQRLNSSQEPQTPPDCRLVRIVRVDGCPGKGTSNGTGIMAATLSTSLLRGYNRRMESLTTISPAPPLLDGSYCLAGGAYSSIYPDRPIRPLPKRPLRSRLSQEAADSILYPPAPPATQLFYNAHLGNGGGTEVRGYLPRNADTVSYGSDRSPDRDHHHHHHHHRPYENGADGDSGDEDGPVVVRRSAGFRGSPFSPVYASHPDGSQIKSSSSPSVPDGYDAFENTNNKKKRKIPTSGTLTGHHSSLTADLASMGLASSAPTSSSSPVALGDGGGGAGTCYVTGNPTSTSSGISGSGRGRFGRSTARSSSARNPLSAHTPNTWLGARSGTSRRDLTPSALGPMGTAFPLFSVFFFVFFLLFVPHHSPQLS